MFDANALFFFFFFLISCDRRGACTEPFPRPFRQMRFVFFFPPPVVAPRGTGDNRRFSAA